MRRWRRIAAFVLAAVSLSGAVALSPEFRLEPFRQSEPPVIRVELGDAGAPREFMAGVLASVIGAFGGIDGIRAIEARAAVGVASIDLMFARGARRDALSDARARLESLRGELPATVVVLGIARTEIPPLARIHIRSDGASFEDVARWAEEHVAGPARLMPGVASVSRRQDDVQVVEVLPESRRLAAHGLTILDISTALRQVPLTTRAGLATVPVRMPAGDSVPLATLAQIRSVPQPPQPPVVELAIVAGERAHTLATLSRIEAHLEWLRANGIVPAAWQVELTPSHASTWRGLERFMFAALLAVAFAAFGVGAMAGARGVGALLANLLVMLPAGGALLAAGGFAFFPATFIGLAAAVIVTGVFVVANCRPSAIVVAIAVIVAPGVFAGWWLPEQYEIFRVLLLAFSSFLLPALLWQAAWPARADAAPHRRSHYWARIVTGVAQAARPLRVIVAAAGVAGMLAVMLLPWDEPPAGGQERTLRARLYGTDALQLARDASDLTAGLKAVAGVAAARHSLESLTLQWRVELAEEKAALLGIAEDDIRRIVNVSLEGAALGGFVEGSRRWQVRLALPEIERERADAVERVILAGEIKGRPLVYLREVATAERQWDHARTQRDLRGDYVEVAAVLAPGAPVGETAAVAQALASAGDGPGWLWVGSGASVQNVRHIVAGALAAGFLVAVAAAFLSGHRRELAQVGMAALAPLPGVGAVAFVHGSFSAPAASAVLLAVLLALAAAAALLVARTGSVWTDSSRQTAGLTLLPFGLLLLGVALLPVALTSGWTDFVMALWAAAISALLLWPWVLPGIASRRDG